MAKYCEKCGRMMDELNFYTYRDGTKTEQCKKCFTMHIDNFKPDTYLWLLEKMDVPYVEEEWNNIRDKAFQKDPLKMNGMSVFGKYLSIMKLAQWKKYRWADTEKIREDRAKVKAQNEEMLAAADKKLKEDYDAGLISEAQYKTLISARQAVEETKKVAEIMREEAAQAAQDANSFNESQYMSEEELATFDAELTLEDKLYLATKWGRLYRPSEWVALEKLYADYDKSFELHNADLERGTLQLCKLILKGNQALDSGDYDGYAKLARAADALRKSLKFTEAQRKEDKTAEFSCYGHLVAFAELNNDEDYIPPIDLDIDRDIIDKDIKDMKNWTKNLIEEDPTIFRMIEQYIKKRSILEEMEQDRDAAGDDGYQITDEDLINFRRKIEEDEEEDKVTSEGSE